MRVWKTGVIDELKRCEYGKGGEEIMVMIIGKECEYEKLERKILW